MSAIGERVFATGAKKCLVIGGEEFVRPLSCGPNWNILRFVFSYAIAPNGTSAITGARWVVGLCAGNNLGRTYNSSNTSNYYGCLINHSDESTGRTLNYQANSGNPYYNQGTDRGYHFTRVGNTTSKTAYATVGGLPTMPTTGGTIQRRGVFAIEAHRPTATGTGTAAWSMRMGCTMSAAAAAVDWYDEYMKFFIGPVGISGDPYNGNVVWTNLNVPAVAPDEAANGYLDSVSIFWNKSDFPMEIYEMMAIRIR